MQTTPTSNMTLRDVAEAAEVSVSTVSRVLRGDLGWVGEATARRVRDEAERLGYHPSATARALVAGRTNVVVVACERPDDPHPARMLVAAQRLADECGFHTVLSPLGPDAELERLLRERRTDVILYARRWIERAEALLPAISAPHQVVVAAGPARTDGPWRVSSAHWSQEEGISLAVRHLAELGHRQVAFLAGASGGARLRLFLEVAARYEVEATAIRLDAEPDNLGAGAQMARLALRQDPRPSALVCRNDEFAIGAMRALQDAGIAIPGEIAVMGYGGIPAAGYTNPRLTTVYTPFAECASHVLRMALERPSGASRPQEPVGVRLPVRLIIRESTAGESAGSWQ